MDGANVEIVEEVGEENAFIFGMTSEQVLHQERTGEYFPRGVYNTDADVRRVVDQLVDGTFSADRELFRPIYASLLDGWNGSKADPYFILADFRSYAEAHERVTAAYQDKARWARMAMMNTACSGKFSSDRTIREYVDEIWHLEKVTLE